MRPNIPKPPGYFKRSTEAQRLPVRLAQLSSHVTGLIPQHEDVEPDDDIGEPHIRDHLDNLCERQNRKDARQNTLLTIALRRREII